MSVDFLIPAYNCEKYLEKCVKSIHDCNTEDYNIIIYNDGSNDKTLDIAICLRDSNKNIIVINSEKNYGVVHARFELIKNSKSDYIFFIDSDDYILNCSPIFEKSKENKYDIIQFNRKRTDSKEQLICLDTQKTNFVVTKNKFNFFGRWGKENNITYSIHNKLIRRNLFENFLYEESAYPQIFEDILMNIYLISQNPTIKLSNEYTYVYRTQIESLTTNPIKIIDASLLLVEYIHEHFRDAMGEKSLHFIQRNVFEYYILNKIKNECIQKSHAVECYDRLFSILNQKRYFFNDLCYYSIISRIFSHAIVIFDIHNIASIATKNNIDIDNAIYNTIKITHNYSIKKSTPSPQHISHSNKNNIFILKYRKIKRAIYKYIYSHKKPYIAIIDYPGRNESRNYLEHRLALPVMCFDSWDTRMSTKIAIENARLVITSVPYAPLSKLKLKGKVFNCWHGSGAFKKFGKYDIDNQDIYGTSDYIICSSEKIRKIYADSMELPINRVFATGTPRTDIYFNKQEIKIRTEKFYIQYPQLKNKKIYVYLPTYREFRKKRFFKLNFSIKDLDNMLNKDEIFIIKNHPSIISRIEKNKSYKHKYTNIESYGKVLNLNEVDTETLTIISNVFITDYSSSFFEAMLLNKPLVFYAEDFNEYTRDFYFDYENLPGEKVLNTSPSALLSAIRRANSFTDKKVYHTFREEYMGLCDGKSTDRVVDIIQRLISKK